MSITAPASATADAATRIDHRPTGRRKPAGSLAPYLQATPLALILFAFLLVPIAVIVVVSFLDYNSVQILPNFVWSNYTDTLFDHVTWETYLNTVKYTVIVWAITLFIGFWVAYFLAFHIRSTVMQMVLFLVCTIPFLTSNIIRMISWVPFLGRNGLLNSALLRIGLIHHPLEFLLFSDFAVILAFVHLNTLFMVVPIFNTMMRIDRRLMEAAVDAGAKSWQVILEVILPLCKPGIAIGTIFIVTLVMGDFITVRLMSGGQRASVGLMISNQISLLQYPAACANAVVLLAVVLLMIGGILRLIDIRAEL
ncbi:MAG TPA: ABC transporter permease [Acetobacteraceae bacterium]|nr:ABC transporter permease [Acetobacteraceae bacterium]